MLVLTRKTNQSIMIGDDVEVSVLAVSRDKIRLGITAPRDVPVFRKEVYLSIKDEQGESPAAPGASDDNDGDGAEKLAKSE
jgi:carbon storage regulator